MEDILYKELSYKIVGCAFEMYNTVGFGYLEKHYQAILAQIFDKSTIRYKKELFGRIVINDRIIAKYYLDFLVEDKVIVELKVAKDFYDKHVSQVLTYLKAHNLKLGIIVLITKDGIKIKRIANSRNLRK